MKHIELLTTDAKVAELAGQLAAETAIAVDLEADSLHNYQEKICLIQISTTQRTVLIDPLAAQRVRRLAAAQAAPPSLPRRARAQLAPACSRHRVWAGCGRRSERPR